MVSTFSMKRMCAGLVGLLCAAQIHATVFQVTVDTTGLAGTTATLAFDLVSGDADTGPSSVTISDFSGVGTDFALGDAFLYPDLATTVSTLASPVILDEADFFNEFLQQLTLGTSFTFRFSATGNAPSDPSGSPDAFSFFLLDATGSSLVTTGDAGDPQAILRYNIGNANGPDVFAIIGPPETSVRVAEVSTAVHEPAAVMLVLAGLLALAVTRTASVRSRVLHARAPSPAAPQA